MITNIRLPNLEEGKSYSMNRLILLCRRDNHLAIAEGLTCIIRTNVALAIFIADLPIAIDGKL
jgi:hypothetical protein